MSIQDQFESIGKQHQQGATIGDGMRASANVAAWLGGITLLVKTLPLLIPLAAACLFFFRGCSLTPYLAATKPPSAPPAPRLQSLPSPIPPPRSHSVRPSTTSTKPWPRVITPTEPSNLREVEPEPFHPQQRFMDPAPSMNPVAEAALDVAADMYQDTPIGLALQLLPDLARAAQSHQQQLPPSNGPLHAPFNFNAPRMAGHGPPSFPQTRRGYHNGAEVMHGMLSNPSGQQMYSVEGMFDSIAGRKFVGTCQLPEEPSRRVELAIDRIRDRGSNITARLKLIDGRRKSLNVTGVIESDPPRLILIPKQHPSSFGMFVTHQSWYSQSPTRITLYMDGAKILSGESVAGEQFELLPKESPRAPPSTSTPSIDRMQDGDEITWTITHRNSKPTSADQCWQFVQTSRKRGNFVWSQSGQTKATGRYNLPGMEVGDLTLSLKQGEKVNIHRCLFERPSPGLLRVCVPQAGAERPTKLERSAGHIFSLTIAH